MHRPPPVTSTKWTCLLCNTSSCATRYLSTTRTARVIGPESPKYIDVPKPPQERHIPKRRMKGILPVPRDIFPAKDGGLEKVTDKYLDAATQDAKEKSTWGLTEPQKAQMDWKLRMAAKRKQNLREGLRELQARRRGEESDRIEKRAQIAANLAETRRIQRERSEEDRLTSPTVVKVNELYHTAPFLPDPNRFERITKMKANFAAHEARKVELRRKSLHELYMNARTFIVNEKDMDTAIDKAFGTIEQPRSWGDRGESIWFEGLPATVKKMMEKPKKELNEHDKKPDPIIELTEDRMKKIAGELTGGKMDESKYI